MIEDIRELCKEHAQSIAKSATITIHETSSQHSDFLTVSFILDRLAQDKPVTFVACRENYAHYLALSKKMGKSIEPFLKAKIKREGFEENVAKLTYYECFVDQLCAELPLTQTSPATYTDPPGTVTKISLKQLAEMCEKYIVRDSSLIVDAVSFLEHLPELCYTLYETGVSRNCQIILGGCSMSGRVAQVLRREADLWIELENDVSNHGKFKICSQSNETSVLWKWLQGKFQISKYIKL